MTDTMYLDSRLSKWRPRVRPTDEGWILSVKIETGTFLEFRVKGYEFKIIVTIGPEIHAIGPSQFQSFGQKHDLPIEEVVTALIERWRFLNLVAEF